jgi:hypothetical protein
MRLRVAKQGRNLPLRGEPEREFALTDILKSRRFPALHSSGQANVGLGGFSTSISNAYFTVSEQSTTLDAHWSQFLVRFEMFPESG